MSKTHALAILLGVISVILIGASFFLPWYERNIYNDVDSEEGTEFYTHSDYYLQHRESRGTYGNIDYEEDFYYNDNPAADENYAVWNLVFIVALGALLLAIASVLTLYFIPKGIASTLILLATILFIFLAPTLFYIQYPNSWGSAGGTFGLYDFNDARVGSATESGGDFGGRVHFKFYDEDTLFVLNGEYTYGPSWGWWMMIMGGAFAILSMVAAMPSGSRKRKRDHSDLEE